MSMLKKSITLAEHLATIQAKGGKARAASMTAEERSEHGKKAVNARWAKYREAQLKLKKKKKRSA